MKRTLIAFAALAMLLPLTVRTNAQNTNPPPAQTPPAPHMRRPMLVPRPVLGKLELTAAQNTQYEAIQMEFDKARDAWMEANQAEIGSLHQQMLAARQANDHAKMETLRDQLREKNQPMTDMRKQYLDKVRAILTDEQKKKLDEMMPAKHGGPGEHEPPHEPSQGQSKD